MSYVVNPRGFTHSVPDGWLDRLLSQGFRPATQDEIAQWYAAQGLSNPHAPAPPAAVPLTEPPKSPRRRAKAR